MIDDILYTEKYRPSKVGDCILPERIKKIFQSFVNEGNFPNLLLTGSAGTGKTTIAQALCKELDYDYIKINASDDRNIDTIRNRVSNFAGTRSLQKKKKAIILDEADGLSAVAQGALRGVFEQFPNVKFILTCNFKNKIIEPISKSRVSVIEFSIKPDEKDKMIAEMTKRVIMIMETEKIKYDLKVAVELVKKFYPDNRRILNDLQTYCRGGILDNGILTNRLNMDEIIDLISSQNFKGCKDWVAKNNDIDITTMYTFIYDNLYDKVKPEDRPKLVKYIGDSQKFQGFATNHEIHIMALIAEIMMDVELI